MILVMMNVFKSFATFFLCFAFSGFLRAYEVFDCKGRKFEFSEPPKAVSISPAVSETICAVGAGGSLLGVSKFCKYPKSLSNTESGKAIREELSKKEVVGGFVDADFEKILALKPDIVVLHDISADFLMKKFESLGIRVFLVYADGLENIARNAEIIGSLFGKGKEGVALAEKIRLETADKSSFKNRPRAIFLFGNMSAGVDTYAGRLLQNCGFENVVKNTKAAWAVLPKEYILVSSPQAVLVQSDDESDFERKKSELKKSAVWSKTEAVKKGNIFMMPTDLIITPSPRIVYAAEKLRKIRAEMGD